MIEIRLPYPPSANKLWTVGRKANGHGRTILTREYYAFLSLLHALKANNPSLFPRLTASAYSVDIIFFPPRKGKVDVDNRNKAILDGLTRLGVWRDDSLVVKLTTIKGKPAQDPFALVRIEQLDSFYLPSPSDFGGKDRTYKSEQKKNNRKESK